MLISPAYAQGATPAGASGPGYEQFFIIIGMFALLYFLMIRPQMKRAKEHKQMAEALQKVNEILGARLNTLHNLHYYQTLMGELRDAIAERKFADYAGAFREERRKLGKTG